MADKEGGTSAPQTHRVFVYGTLRRGQRNHHLLASSRFVGEAATLHPFWMITTGPFPVLLDQVPDDFGVPALAVAGEIYHVDDATRVELDRLEREGIAYDRKVTELFEAGHRVEAYIYVGVADYWQPRGFPAWKITNERDELEWAAS